MDTWDLKRIKAFKHAAEKPLLLDILFAGVLSWAVLRKAAADDHVAMGDVIVAFVAFVAVLLRRVRPRVALGIAVASTVGAILHGVSNPGLIAALGVITYSIAAHTSRRKGLACALLGSALIYVTGLIVAPGDWWRFESLAVFAWIFMAAAVGDAVRTHKAYIHEVEERARHAEQTREDEARRRVMDERVRIARELHDVVAHHIAVISVQAGAAAHVLDRSPEQVGPVLAHIREASDTVLREIQSVVGVLRNEDEATSTEPAPGLARLPELLTALESAHFSVRSQQRGPTRDLPALVDLAAYRIVQEALTNAHKHGTGPVRLLIEYAPSGIILEVTNEIRPGSPGATRATTASGAATGPAAAGSSAAGSVAGGLGAAGLGAAGLGANGLGANGAGAAGSVLGGSGSRGSVENGSGYGLLGMRERAVAAGGQVTAAPLGDGRFRVHAVLPTEHHAPATAPDPGYKSGVEDGGTGRDCVGVAGVLGAIGVPDALHVRNAARAALGVPHLLDTRNAARAALSVPGLLDRRDTARTALGIPDVRSATRAALGASGAVDIRGAVRALSGFDALNAFGGAGLLAGVGTLAGTTTPSPARPQNQADRPTNPDVRQAPTSQQTSEPRQVPDSQRTSEPRQVPDSQRTSEPRQVPEPQRTSESQRFPASPGRQGSLHHSAEKQSSQPDGPETAP
ncbi:hypothetical protein GCM10010435_87400 [Winogradskya consettensis]|uniref:histidine kinase n=1 Tax=Winogradskya consettensis TaxID=113560 RepID=A0A919T0Y4_9ACTN|nr:histidine kinase [Actinoplanes consettensis]GIM80843.1 hypothetical protein Aco04nite_73030 [Actinoplanes consettensis]